MNLAITVIQFLYFIFLKYILLLYCYFFTVILCLLTENVNTEHEHTSKQNKFPKLPELYIVLQKIDEANEGTIQTDRQLRNRKIRI